MISRKLKIIFGISVPIFIAHGLEEYFFGFYYIDNIFTFTFRTFETMTIPQATFLLFQIMIWLLLVIFFLLITNEKLRLWLMLVPGLVYIFEVHHIFRALASFSYYPGLITAIALAIIGFFFWKELLRNYKKSISREHFS